MKPESLVVDNLFSNIPEQLPEELLQTLLQVNALRIERIVSKGHSTPICEWYDQDWDEWILVVQGRAQLELDKGQIVDLKSGDYLLLPAHQKHRVNWTDSDVETIWLAIHFSRNS